LQILAFHKTYLFFKTFAPRKSEFVVLTAASTQKLFSRNLLFSNF